MDTLSLELLVPLAFVAALLWLERLRPELRAEHREASRYIIAGVFILAITSLLKLYFQMGYLRTLPFLSEPLFHRMILWVGIILGTVCVVTGMSQWLQEHRARKQRLDERIRRLDAIRRLVQITNVESRPERMFELALNCLIEGFDFSGGVVYRYSLRQSTLIRTTVRCDGSERHFPEFVRYQAGSIDDQAAFAHACADLIGSLPRVIPVRVGTRLAALFVLWRNQSPLPQAVDQDLRIGVDILAASLEHRLESLRGRFFERRDRWQKELLTAAGQLPNVRKSLTRLVRLVKPMIPCDAVVITLVNRRTGLMRRFTWGVDEQPLLEKGSTASAWGVVWQVLRSGEMSAGLPRDLGSELPFALLPMRSELHVPVLRRRASGAVLSFLSTRPQAFGPIAAHLAGVASEALFACLRDQSRRRLHRRVRAQLAQLHLLRRPTRPPLTRADVLRMAAGTAFDRGAAGPDRSISPRLISEHLTGVPL